ncbi:hypothetical protein HAX54_050766 [Datura stramonium]|uniref:Translin-associated factor X-interacting protein 1 N-terminal domain-containing protein n=1 Tax=Datura stramonium TaxID=4076 RepID=A0ABS8WPJ4_DATST|nr:hypothetical protein [Datura stramonium]
MVTTRSSLQAASSSSTLQGWLPYKRRRRYRKVCKICSPKEAPAVPLPPVPPTGSNGNIPERVLMKTNYPELVPPPPVPPTGPNGNIPEQVSMSTNATELVPPPAVPPLGSTSDRPVLIPCDEEEEQRETKLNLNPLSRLKVAKKTHTSTKGYSSKVHEKSKNVITDEVKSLLVSQLTSGTSTSVDDMVTFANRAFTTLNWFGADYGSFYKDVKDLIAYKYDLLTAERKLDMLSVSELEKKYLDVVIRANDIEEEIEHIQLNQKMDKEKKEPLKRQIEDARELIRRLEREVADIEQDEKCLKDDEQKYKAAHKIAQAEVEILGTQMEAARVMQREIEWHKNEALQGIESTTRLLLPYK